MKKNFLPAIIAVMLITGCAQELKESDVPQAVKDAFNTKYPGTTVTKWEKEGEAYEAEYTANGKEMGAEFKADGTFIKEEEE